MAKKLIYSDFVIKVCVVAVLMFFVWSVYDRVSANSNAFLANNGPYQVISVNQGDTLWSIAANYSAEKDDIRLLICAIKQVNDLPEDVTIYPGEQLKIPQSSAVSQSE